MVTASDPARLYATVRDLILRSRGDLLWLRPDQWRGPREGRMTALVAEALASSGRSSRAIYPVHATTTRPPSSPPGSRSVSRSGCCPSCRPGCSSSATPTSSCPTRSGTPTCRSSIVRQPAVVADGRALVRAAVGAGRDPRSAGRRAARCDLRRFLLQQLAVGAHDEQIARKLGISLRTVRRRVADLMRELGADTRFQAGVEAARRGWLLRFSQLDAAGSIEYAAGSTRQVRCRSGP